MNRGEVRLLGWTDTSLHGVQFHPAASQLTARTMVLVHLRHADLPVARIDERSRWVDQQERIEELRRFDREEAEKRQRSDAAESDSTDQPKSP